jgi:hypothetical protein
MGTENLNDVFNNNTTTQISVNGVRIDCKKGNWGVSAPTEMQAYNEAWHYFMQYYRDGEYGCGK